MECACSTDVIESPFFNAFFLTCDEWHFLSASIRRTDEFSDRFTSPSSENYFALLIFRHPTPLILFRSPYLYLMKLECFMPFGTSKPPSIGWPDTTGLVFRKLLNKWEENQATAVMVG